MAGPGARPPATAEDGTNPSAKAERSSDATSPDARILEAARELFFTEGFSLVTTDRLAHEAGVSKSSIYKYFGDMTGVLRAVVAAEGEAFGAGVPLDPRTPEEFREGLVLFGVNFLALVDDPRTMRFEQSILEQARAHPDVARTFHDAALVPTQHALERLIETGRRRGFVRSRLSSADLADHLLSLWKGARHAKAQLGLDEPRPRPARAWVRQCVELLFSPCFDEPCP